MTVSPQAGTGQGGERDDRLRERACRSRVNGQQLQSGSRSWQQLNEIGGRNGVGRIDMVENRFVGMKSRGVYEAPGMTILYEALMYVEQLTLDRDLMHLRDRLAPEVAEMVYYGFWYAPKMDALLAFIREAQKHATGEVASESVQGQHHGRRPSAARTACTTRGSPRWKAAARTIRRTPRVSLRISGTCRSRVSRAA